MPRVEKSLSNKKKSSTSQNKKGVFAGGAAGAERMGDLGDIVVEPSGTVKMCFLTN